MTSVVSLEPDPNTPVLLVGQDRAGHWLVQDNGGRLEGRFISFAAAMNFARAERHAFPGARIALAGQPLVPQVSFVPVRPDERARPDARTMPRAA